MLLFWSTMMIRTGHRIVKRTASDKRWLSGPPARRKPSLIERIPGDPWGTRINLAALYRPIMALLGRTDERPLKHAQRIDYTTDDPLAPQPPTEEILRQGALQAREQLNRLDDEPTFGTKPNGRRRLNLLAAPRRRLARIQGYFQRTNSFIFLQGFDLTSPNRDATMRRKAVRALDQSLGAEERGEAHQASLVDQWTYELSGRKWDATQLESWSESRMPVKGELTGRSLWRYEMAKDGFHPRRLGVPASPGLHPRHPVARTKEGRLYPFDEDNPDPTFHRAWTGTFAISPRKLQHIADLIKGLSVDHAILQMRFSPKAAAQKVLEMLERAKRESAQRGFDMSRLVIDEAWTGKGDYSFELQVRGRGRHGRVQHPSAAMYVVLREGRSRQEKREHEARKEMEKRLRQRGVPPGASKILPGFGKVPVSARRSPVWAW